MLYNPVDGKFVRGPISLNQLNEFCRYGINAVRIYCYIRMQEGKLVSKRLLQPKEHTFIKSNSKITKIDILFKKITK